MSVEAGSVDVVVRARLDRLEHDFARALAGARRFDNQMSGGMRHSEQAISRLSGATGNLAFVMRRLQFAVAAAVSAFSVGSIVRTTSAYSDLRSMLANVVGGFAEAEGVMDRLEQVSRRTYSSFQVTAQSFVYNARTLKSLGYSTSTVLDFTEALNNALVVSGAKGEQAARVQFALTKAMGVGALRGQELNAVMEVGGRVAQVLADELTNGNVPALKALGAAGKITGDVMIRALTKRMEELRLEAENMPATLGDAITLFGNAVFNYIGKVDTALGATERLSARLVGVIDGIKGAIQPTVNLVNLIGRGLTGALDAMSISAGTATRVGQILLVNLIGVSAVLAVRTLTAAVTGLSRAFLILSAIMLANPLIRFVTIMTTLISAVILFRDTTGTAFGDIMKFARDTANTVVGSFTFAYDSIQTIWSTLPDMFQVVLGKAQNWVLSKLKTFVDDVAKVLNLLPFVDIDAGRSIETRAVQIEEAQARISAAFGSLRDKTMADATRDWVGELVGVVTASDDAAASTSALDDEIDKLIKTLTADQAKAAEAYADIVQGSRDFISSQELERAALGMTAQAAAQMRNEQDLLNKARDADVVLTSKQRAQLMGLASDMAAAEEQTSRLADAFGFTKDLFAGFLQDMRSGLQQGKSLWESFANAVTGVIDKIVDRLLTNLVDAIFTVNQSAGGGSGGMIVGLISKLLGIGGGGGIDAPMSILAPGLHRGGRAGSAGTTRAVSPLAFVGAPRLHGGLAADELPAILQRGETVVPRGGSMPGSRVRLEVVVGVDETGNIVPVVRQVAGSEADVRIERNNRFVVPGMIHRARGRTVAEVGRVS